MRKRRSDSKLFSLPEEYQAELADSLLAGMSLKEARKKLKKEQKLSVSESALSHWLSVVGGERMLFRRIQAANLAESFCEQARRAPVNWDAATLEKVGESIFRKMSSPDLDDKDLEIAINLKALDIRRQEIELKRRRLALLEKQAEQTRQVISDEKMTPEQQRQKIREIFGVA